MKKILCILAIASVIACSNNAVNQQKQTSEIKAMNTPAITESTPTPVTPVTPPNQTKATTPKPPVASPSQTKATTPNPPVESPSQTKAEASDAPANTSLISWQINKDKMWRSNNTPVACGPLDELFSIFPIDISILMQFARPGRATTMGNDPIYVAHGSLRADNTPHDQISVKFPATGFSLYAVNRRTESYIDSDEEQVKLEFMHPCGILLRLDHLAQLSDRWATIIQDVPVTSDSRVTFFPQHTHFVTQGEVIANGIGHASNTYLDFGVYDLRQNNNIANYIATDWPEYQGSADHGICWPLLFSTEIETLLYSLPAGAVATSDYCD